MNAREIKENIYWVGALDWDRRLFDELIPLPDGTSYNAYLIQGSEKNSADRYRGPGQGAYPTRQPHPAWRETD